MPDLDKITAWENGELSDEDTLGLFSQLIKEGTAWTLQGVYGRTAANLISNGLISQDGTVDWDRFETIAYGPRSAEVI